MAARKPASAGSGTGPGVRRAWCIDGGNREWSRSSVRWRRNKGEIDRADRTAEALGLPVWCADKTGAYQAIPRARQIWRPVGRLAQRGRGGTARLLTLFRPATGEVRARPVERAPNAILHPWFQQELTAILADLPPPAAE
ncbi:MAG: hypothetical protein M3354_02245 [Chloroflexota bacterium]|nr:hypothetical protein [Chloroflexota bacterium]